MLLKASENYVRKVVEDGLRVDGRKFDQFREIKIITDIAKKAEGSALVSIGNTQVLVGVKLSVGEPYHDTPAEGVLIVNTELVPIASPTFEPGPPDASAIEIARVVDRSIRESHCIGLEKLCIKPKEKVWIINVDIHVLDHDGNLIDASALAAMAALSNTRMPKYNAETDEIVYEEHDGALLLLDKPIEVTVGKISDKLLVDTNLEEEFALDARLTIATNSKCEICAMQKGEKGFFTFEEIEKAIELAVEKGKELRKLLGDNSD